MLARQLIETGGKFPKCRTLLAIYELFTNVTTAKHLASYVIYVVVVGFGVFQGIRWWWVRFSFGEVYFIKFNL